MQDPQHPSPSPSTPPPLTKSASPTQIQIADDADNRIFPSTTAASGPYTRKREEKGWEDVDIREKEDEGGKEEEERDERDVRKKQVGFQLACLLLNCCTHIILAWAG